MSRTGRYMPVKRSRSAYDISLYISTTPQPTQTAGPVTRPTGATLITTAWNGSTTTAAPSGTIVGTEGTTGKGDFCWSSNSIMT
jgi:hypothetical protein